MTRGAGLGAAGDLEADVRVRLGGFSLEVSAVARAGAVLAVLGPNGAGKTTLLRALAGQIALDEGCVRLGARVLDDPSMRAFVPPEARRVGFVHQDHLLFPHLSVLENVAFGPRSTGTRRRPARERARDELDAVGLADRAGDRPAHLSAGQAQRVALARALAAHPDMLLLDEPLSALDATTRSVTRRDLRRRLDGYRGVTVLVTHDPVDALTLADDVLVLEGGRPTQAGPVAEVATRPRTRYVADLVGTNHYDGTARGTTVEVGGATIEVAEATAGSVHVIVPPTAITLHPGRPTSSARNRWRGTVGSVEVLGPRARVRVEGPLPVVAEITVAALAALALQVGDEVWATAKATEVDTYPA